MLAHGYSPGDPSPGGNATSMSKSQLVRLFPWLKSVEQVSQHIKGPGWLSNESIVESMPLLLWLLLTGIYSGVSRISLNSTVGVALYENHLWCKHSQTLKSFLEKDLWHYEKQCHNKAILAFSTRYGFLYIIHTWGLGIMTQFSQIIQTCFTNMFFSSP